jgi:hypothetical protein
LVRRAFGVAGEVRTAMTARASRLLEVRLSTAPPSPTAAARGVRFLFFKKNLVLQIKV